MCPSASNCQHGGRPVRTAPLHDAQQREQEHDGAHVLADEQQQRGPDQQLAVVAPVERVDGEGEQRSRERDLVEVEVDQRLHRPAEPVRTSDDERHAVPGTAPGEPVHDRDRGRDEHGLRDQQHDRVVPDPVQRRQHGDDRVEVIAEDVVAGSLERDHRRPEVRVRAHGLVEYAEVVSGRAVLDLGVDRMNEVERQAAGGEDRDAAVPAQYFGRLPDGDSHRRAHAIGECGGHSDVGSRSGRMAGARARVRVRRHTWAQARYASQTSSTFRSASSSVIGKVYQPTLTSLAYSIG